ncbi:tRNA (adenosine(37)-N6)-threonylcarbamoyltransferase complex dimerization subunit type 1 TsaB [Seleniivibrio woodruffii]|uniref:tRNA threonylcarbamoyl adenosine modification protein YeaZ n=1 Tax=Seleniivibrio woodruffii TaxID=1078050 RepID=A0A4R1K8N4_9BACT|nr:tRNA (adenosine(37)-N6)-threonylcarbamoyltransferase complex dimerization subunit type 1 TsaB [Seleniivibrio woodruffii]TCK60718.1 tRNA threonylcarbamoyl adenosine modification protein YeaZ [Seleniivibrio woodruffii]TVZ36348.1 tRNA threonylcarbamoyl adenosine modification protein YeaZ [Seleniivibrio woodruffii]
MKYMLADTSGKGLAVTICDEHRKPFSSIFLTLENSLSEKMLWALDGLLSGSGLCPSDIDRFFIVKGPGSFTGIRVGVATLLGFCMAHGKVLQGISSLDAAAIVSGREKVTTAVRLRGRLYGYRHYDFGNNDFSGYLTDKFDNIDDFLLVNSVGGQQLNLSEAILSDRFESFLGDYAPMYMRPSEAEINFDKKCGA